ncbi:MULTISPECIES: thioredoxin fold domain-containing protein [unclassified Cupriavidus]|uniref:thioredoxin fold domain-containing protein n=1 Tax=unclassified Cupriavidus TaxID=2640874 RepID=UPI001484D1F5|nr:MULTISPECIES: thioredoxin fold domain-containing protein [unclassified Cupriavidus]
MLGTMLLAGGIGVASAAAHLPPVTDIAAQSAAAARDGEPLVVLVTLPGCSYCETVRRNYLGPQLAAGEIAAREIDMTADTPIRDVDGTMTTAKRWAQARNISMAPTVLFLDRQGRNLANPLRGMQADFYGAYLEQALDEARARVSARSAAR